MRVKAVPIAMAVESCLEELRKRKADISRADIQIIVNAPLSPAHSAFASRRLGLPEVQRSRQ